MVTALTEQGNVYLEGESLTLVGFTETDPEVVSQVAAAEDPEAAVHRCLQVGARALCFAQVNVDTAYVETAFDSMKDDLERTANALQKSIDAAARGFLDPEHGEFTVIARQIKDDFSALLDAVVDPDSKKSLIAKFEEAMTQAQDRHALALTMLIDPDKENSPLARWRGEIVRTITSRSDAVMTAVTQLAEQLRAKEVERAVFDLTTVKGFTFEEQVNESISNIVAPLGDVLEPVGTTRGVKGNQKGDAVVALSEEGPRLNVVVECKDRKLGLKQILDELDDAIENREAAVGVAVFSRQSLAPVQTPLQVFGNRIIVVYEKDEPDIQALRAAMHLARWLAVCGRQRPDQFDTDRVTARIEDVQRSMARLTAVKRFLTLGRKNIDEASAQVDALGSEVSEAIDALCEAVA